MGLKGMVSRSEWGADESYLFDSGRKQEAPPADTAKGDNGVIRDIAVQALFVEHGL